MRQLHISTATTQFQFLKTRRKGLKMSAKNPSSSQISEFESDYLNYLNSNEQLDKMLVVETISQRNQRMAKPSGPCGCDNCQFQPPTPDFQF